MRAAGLGPGWSEGSFTSLFRAWLRRFIQWCERCGAATSHRSRVLLFRLFRDGPAFDRRRFLFDFSACLFPILVGCALRFVGVLPQIVGARANLFLLRGLFRFLFHLITSVRTWRRAASAGTAHVPRKADSRAGIRNGASVI